MIIDEQPLIDEQPITIDEQPLESSGSILDRHKRIQAEVARVQGVGATPVGDMLTRGLGALYTPMQQLQQFPEQAASFVGNLPTMLGNKLLPGQDVPLPFAPNKPILDLQPAPGYMESGVNPMFKALVQSGTEKVNQLSTPGMVAQLPLAGANAAGMAAPLGGAFIAQMAASLPEEAVKTIEDLNNSNLPQEEKNKQAASLLIDSLATGLGGYGVLKEGRGEDWSKPPVEIKDTRTVNDVAEGLGQGGQVPTSRQLGVVASADQLRQNAQASAIILPQEVQQAALGVKNKAQEVKNAAQSLGEQAKETAEQPHLQTQQRIDEIDLAGENVGAEAKSKIESGGIGEHGYWLRQLLNKLSTEQIRLLSEQPEEVLQVLHQFRDRLTTDNFNDVVKMTRGHLELDKEPIQDVELPPITNNKPFVLPLTTSSGQQKIDERPLKEVIPSEKEIQVQKEGVLETPASTLGGEEKNLPPGAQAISKQQNSKDAWKGMGFDVLPAKTVPGSEPNAGGGFALEGPAAMRDEKVLGFREDQKPDAQQLMNRLTNLGQKGKFSPSELDYYKEQGLEGFLKDKPTVRETAKWMEENGPKVEVRKFGEGSAQTPEQKRFVQLEHEIDSHPEKRLIGKVLTYELPEDIAKLSEGAKKIVDEYRPLNKVDLQKGVEESKWQSISPKSESDMKGYTEIAVVKPTVKRPLRTMEKGVAKEHPDRIVEDANSVKFPSSHNFPPNTLAWVRGHMETDTTSGKKTFLIHEVQSDWAQHQRNEREQIGNAELRGLSPETRKEVLARGNDPLLAHYESLALKAAIEHARSEGADIIAISDAETAMMTEGHDRASQPVAEIPYKKGIMEDLATRYSARRSLSSDGQTIRIEPATPEQAESIAQEFGGKVVRDISQSKGMRAAYDSRLPNIVKKLTGHEGVVKEFGEHKMAFDLVNGGQVAGNVLRPRKDLIFRNPDGTPKTSITARTYPISGKEPFSIMGSKKPFYDYEPADFPSVQDAMNKMGIVPGANGFDVATKIAENPEHFGTHASALAQFLTNHFEHVLRPAKVDPRPDPTVERAAYRTGKGGTDDHTIFADINADNAPTQHFTVLHELAHAATAWQMEHPKTEIQRSAVKEIKALLEQSREALPANVKAFYKDVFEPMYGKSDMTRLRHEAKQQGVNFDKWYDTLYGLTNHHEMIASVFDSKSFRDYLNNIKVEGATMWQRIVDKVKDVLGIKRDSVVDKIFDNLMEVGAEREWGDRESSGLKDLTKDEKVFPSKIMDTLKREREGFKGWWNRSELTGDTIPAMMNRVQNKAMIMARQTANDVGDRLNAALGGTFKSDSIQRQALTMAVEAQGDVAKLDEMKTKLAGTKYEKVVDYAKANIAKLKPVVDFYERVNASMVKSENDNGVSTEFRKGYVPHVQDLRDVNAMLFERGGGAASGFTKSRTHETYADSIKAGIKPYSLDAVTLLENRMATGQRRVNTSKMVEDLKGIVDPSSKEPIVKPLIYEKKPISGKMETKVPPGYEPMFMGNHAIAVHKGYDGLLKSLTGESAFNNSALGRGVMNSVSTMKHTVLGFDTFHPIRLFFYSAPLRATAKNPLAFLKSIEPGVLTLDYNMPTLERMAARGEIPKELLPEILRRKQVAAIGIKTGLNVGKIGENLYSSFIEKLNLPRTLTGGRDIGLGAYNKWVFDRVQRGLMMETYVTEFDRTKAMKPGVSDEDIGREVSKNINIKFGNMMNESWVKNKTMQDVLRLAFLAPQWNEGLIRSEIGGVTQAGKMAVDAATGKRMASGTLVRGMGITWASYFVVNQLINYINRGQPTWENKDKVPGAKISAWVPDKIGKSDGFFLNPFSLSAEVTHTLLNRFEKDQSWTDAVSDYWHGKLAPTGRGLDIFLTNEDWRKNHLKDWELVKEAFKEAAPVPIQAPAIKGAIEGKEAYPGEAQKTLMGSLGVKADMATKTPQERYGEKGGKPYEDMKLGERAKAVRADKAQQEPFTDARARQAAEVKHAEKMYERGEELHRALSPEVQNFVEKNKLVMPMYETDMQRNKVRVPLTKEEEGKEKELMTKEYDKRITALMANPKWDVWTQKQKQDHFDAVLTMARARVKHQVVKGMGVTATPTGQP